MIVALKGPKHQSSIILAVLPAGINHIRVIEMLGMIISDNISMWGHTESLEREGTQIVFELKTLRAHGLSGNTLRCAFQYLLVIAGVP